MIRQHRGQWLVIIASLGAAAMAAESRTYAPGDPQSCLGCHGESGMKPAAGILSTVHGRKGIPGAPMAVHGCQTCHGPSPQHMTDYSSGKPAKPTITFDDRTPVEQQNATCLGCHQSRDRAHWPGSPHEFAGLSCAGCHDIHTPQDKILQKSSQVEVCVDCHKEKRAQMHKTSAHPLVEQQMVCTDCHSPHGTAAEALLAAGSVNETCYGCHAEKRGPFLWEHAPVTESCTHCHQPHGSVHESMLVSRGPWLCQQCHMAAFHPSTAYSGDGMPPVGAAQQVLAKNCMNCHTQVHGSNHPSGVRLTR